jgi:hypothetical protein
MENAIAKSTAVMLSQPESVLNDKDNLIALCLVKGIHCFSKINQVLVQYRLKTLSETKLEEIKFELTKGLFYISCLTHLLDYEPDNFSEEYVEAYAGDFFEEYKEDTILCSMKAIQSFINVSDFIYSNDALFGGDIEFEEEPEESTEDSDTRLDPNIPQLQIYPAVEPGEEGVEIEDIDEDEDEEDDIIDNMTCVFVVVHLLCKRLGIEQDTIIRSINGLNKL